VLERETVIPPELISFLEGGLGFIVATVSPDGEPHATRAWGITVESAADGRVRLLLDAHDAPALASLTPESKIAVTGAHVPTLRSVQLKGRAERLEPATAADDERAARHIDQFFGDIQETDGTPRELPERLVPSAYVACTARVEELFDQTPGPGAGAPIGPGR
jgi:hypothetical protein